MRIDSDSKGVVDRINSASVNVPELGDIIKECRQLLRDNPTYVIGFAKETNQWCNGITYELARVSSCLPS